MKNAWVIILFVILSPLILPLVLVFLCAHLIASIAIYLAVWIVWLPHSKNVLFVYSNSPNWQKHIEENILPQIGDRAIVLNWSERKRWKKRNFLAVMAFRHFGGSREFNPLGVVFRPFRLAKVFRFWQPFKDFKHGKTESLETMRDEFLRVVFQSNLTTR